MMLRFLIILWQDFSALNKHFLVPQIRANKIVVIDGRAPSKKPQFGVCTTVTYGEGQQITVFIALHGASYILKSTALTYNGQND